jgi:hypothetical protein
MNEADVIPAVTIATRTGAKRVRCLATETPGLVLTRAYFGDPGLQQLGLYALTHAATGYAVVQMLPNRDMGQMAARWLGQHGIDWTRGMKELLADEKAQKLVLPLRRETLASVSAICDLADLIDPPPVTRSRCVGRRDRMNA